jgi:hypothetical protein
MHFAYLWLVREENGGAGEAAATLAGGGVTYRRSLLAEGGLHHG